MKPLGRPKNTHARDTLINVALQLVREHGYDKVTISEIAKQANVAKQTLYNNWPTKADLVLEAVFKETSKWAAIDINHSEVNSYKPLIYQFLCDIFDHLKVDGPIITSLIAASQKDSNFRSSFINQFVKPREQVLIEVLNLAKENGELADNRNIQVVSSLIHGAFWYALLQGQELNEQLAKSLINEIFCN